MGNHIEHDKARRRRIAWWITPPAVVVALGVVAFLGVRHSYQDPGPFRVGTCFLAGDDTGIAEAGGLREVSGRAKVVGCGTAHSAEITRTARHPSDCRAEGAWLNSRGQIYCVTFSG
ncbi:hypothetical protein ACFY2R_06720 [Micromonospora olivasterospora]|uniref:hypothetical protein n=1 Tax=Micromonospora olivasterospora TaxID=1880 RepID=UPI00119FAAF8|nr:hypothetical protein [Micromonospora olivasterospora]